ncbi:cytochrome c biogenesis protein CcdA [Hoylesella marshii]|uniref:protein-disulfide reductase DsbD family protein n=1 Tax=Hoylesella marshii TaxID=189722 RepID=UPI0036F3B1F1
MKKQYYRMAIGVFLATVLMASFSQRVSAQMQDPVHFSVQQKQTSPSEVSLIFSATIDEGWHVYSTNMPGGGPISATISHEKMEGAELVGKLQPVGHEITNFDKAFNKKLRYFEKTVKFIQRYKITAKAYRLKGYLEYGACNDEMCLPPTQVDFDLKGKGPAEAPASQQRDSLTEVSAETEPVDTAKVVGATAGDDKMLWQPVVKELQALNGDTDTTDSSWLYIFGMGFIGGLLALFTPCVWPIIPMTVSFFLKRSQSRKEGIRDAVTYGLSIIIIYVGLGLIVTGIAGPNALNALATNAWFNIFFCLLLIVFALSFFGWFEIALPSSWANSVDNKASATGGLISILLMAFTLALVSFSCTGPIIGFLLVQVTSAGNTLGPAIGMLGFALALALPFTLFALFPSWLKQAPKSGSWMNTVKVVLGFIELAFALKFFSVADLAYGWHLMDREVFLSLWIVIFGMLGLYLIGLLRFKSDGSEREAMPVPSIVLGMFSLAFAVYMLPGLWGAPCKAVSAFAPPMNTQDFNLNNKEVHPAFTDYDEGMAEAARQGKPVLLDFTGFGCVNCRKMEAAVWTDPAVMERLTKDYVLISLFVDDKTPLSQPVEVEENGKKRTLRTVGDKWSYLQSHKFGTNAQPFYVAVDNKGHLLTGSFGYKEDISGYMDFLDLGLERYQAGE